MTRRCLGLLLLAVFLGPLAGADDMVVKVIPLRHRTADDLIPVVLPLAGPEGAVSGLDTRLIVRARPADLARIEEAVRAFDTPARPLWITVRQGRARSHDRRGAEAAGRVGVGDGTTVVRRPSGSGGTTSVETRSGRTVVTGAFGQESFTDEGTDVQSLQVLEGARAFIRTGESVPQPGVVVSGDPPLVVPAAPYAEASVGFHVRPRVAGEEVTLEIETAGDRPAGGGGIDVQRIQTTVRGRLGEWIELGGILREQRSRRSEPLAVEQQALTEERSVQVKVEEAR